MKDKNGIEIECENCDDFIPVGTHGRGCTLYEEDCEDVFGKKRCIFRASREAYEARIAELQNENSLLKDGKSHIMEVKMSPKLVKSIIRAANSEIRDLKEELRFTDEEIDFIEKAISMEILDCETNSPKPSDEKLKLMWGIKIKCDELLKDRKD